MLSFMLKLKQIAHLSDQDDNSSQHCASQKNAHLQSIIFNLTILMHMSFISIDQFSKIEYYAQVWHISS